MSVDWGTVGTLGGGFLLFASTVAGIWFKFKIDRQALRDKAAQEKAEREETARKTAADLEARRAQEAYDQMQEDLAAARTEVRALQNDLGLARAEMTRQQEDMQRLWSQFSAVRRELDNAEAHIADVHRWDDGGRHGLMPQRSTA